MVQSLLFPTDLRTGIQGTHVFVTKELVVTRMSRIVSRFQYYTEIIYKYLGFISTTLDLSL